MRLRIRHELVDSAPDWGWRLAEGSKVRQGQRPGLRRWDVPELALLLLGLAGLGVTAGLNLLNAELVHLTRRQSIALFVAGAVLTGAALVLRFIKDHHEARRAWEQTLSGLLAVNLTGAGRLPAVQDVDPYGSVGVSRSRYADTHTDPYVVRDVDDRLDGLLTDQLLVLVVGRSKAGKSRAAFEAIRRVFPHASFLAPTAKAGAIGQLLDLVPPLPLGTGPLVVWLDDLDRYLNTAEGLDLRLLERLASLPQRVVVVATMRIEPYEALHDTKGEIGRAARLVLDHAEPATVWLSSELSDTETAHARQLYPAEDFERGIGEQLVAAPELERRYRNAEKSSDIARVGWALVQTVVDWQRTGLTRPIPEADLRQLYSIYLPARGRYAIPEEEHYSEARAWALKEPEAAPVGLLEQTMVEATRAFRVFDYIVACADGHGDRHPIGTPIQEAVWKWAIEHSTPAEAFTIGITAYNRANVEVSMQAWRAVLASGRTDLIPRAALELGLLLEEQGDVAGAQAAYQQAIDTGHLDASVVAAGALGDLLEEQGDVAGAQAAYQQASDSGHSGASARLRLPSQP